ncbi:MAG: translocation/assembly module TamB [Acidobacteria bacterium]|nr:MAG: translocation/assembly module TamB [Acidobacteriota bacterium]
MPLGGSAGTDGTVGTQATASAGGTQAAGAPGAAAPVAGAPPAEVQTAAEADQAKPQPGFFDAADIDVRVLFPDTLIVRGRDIRPPGGAPIGLGDVNATFGGDIHARKAPGGALELVGEVRTVRGTYDFQGRQFEIQRDGQVRFEGFTPPDPALDITALRVISGVEARVHVGGTVRKPELTLTSQPPLPEADILSLIVFNQPSNQLGEGQQVSLAQRASALATGFVASKLADSLGKALDLDIFQIEAAQEGGQGAAVTLGEQVGQRLFVKLRQGVGAADQTSQLIVEYQLLDFLRLETTFAQGSATRSLLRRVEGTGLDLIFFFSY